MDIVHSHAVKNVNEGLGLLDGDPAQFFHGDHRREHVAWDSLCFDYGKNEVSQAVAKPVRAQVIGFAFLFLASLAKMTMIPMDAKITIIRLN